MYKKQYEAPREMVITALILVMCSFRALFSLKSSQHTQAFESGRQYQSANKQPADPITHMSCIINSQKQPQ